jgi:Sec-independent protein translocase protein TatA
VLFGASRIGDIGKGLGRGIREFRREIKDGQAEDVDDEDVREPAATQDETKR